MGTTRTRRPSRARFAVAVATLVIGACAAHAQTPAPNNLFTAAGFIVRYADTPEKRKLLAKLPADRLVTRTSGGRTYYIYADPNGCVCAYVGTPAAYQAYQNGADVGASGGSGNDAIGIGSPQVIDQGGTNAQRLLGQTEESDEATLPGAPSFDDYVFGGTATD